MEYVLSYEAEDNVSETAPIHFPGHRARYDDVHARGELLVCGNFTDERGGAPGIFTSREAAEEFVTGDPFVLNGVVRSWYVREWNEVLARP